MTQHEPQKYRNRTQQIIEEVGTRNGGFSFSRKTLELWGIPYPPSKGWVKELIRTDALAELPQRNTLF